MKLLEWKSNRFAKKVLIAATCGALLTSPLTISFTNWNNNLVKYIASASTNESTISLQNEQIISSGVKRKDYIFSTTRNNKQISTGFHVMEIDLSNPYISLQAISASGGEVVGKRTTVKNMATQSGAIAAINGDVFAMKNEGAPLGTQIRSQVLQVSPSLLTGMYAFGITTDKKPVIDSYTFEGNVVLSNGSSYALSGMNQSTYSSDVSGETYSHANKLFIYTSAWGGSERPANSATTPTEVLVVDGVITEIPNSGVVTGEIPKNGYVLRGHGDAANFLKNVKVGEQVLTEYNLISKTTKQKIDPAQFEMMISGHTLLLDNGQATAFSRDISGVSGNSYTSRTAVGYSADGKTVYLVTAEKSGANTGVSLKELQSLLKRLGVYKAVNMDGGGSTTMVERKLGYQDIVLSHSTQEGSLRSVANGIGVFTNAPQGQLKGLAIEGANKIFIGQSTAYKYGAYDTYYNPITTAVAFSDSNGLGSFTDASFTAKKSGKTEITASSGSIKATQSLHVIGGQDLTSLVPSATSGALSNGASVDASLVATLATGESYKLDSKYLNWEYIGFKGALEDGKIKVNEVNNQSQYGYAIGKYDGFTTVIPFLGGETVSKLEDFNNVTYSITSQLLPADTTKGGVKLVTGTSGSASDKALSISYNFSEGTGTKASYASFNGSGIALSNQVKALTMDVYGDNGNHWLRAELVDSNGNLHYVDIAKNINWSGWKTVTAQVNAVGDQLKLRRIYVITLDSTKEGLAQAGEVLIDNIKQTTVGIQNTEKKEIKLFIGKNDAVVNGQAMKLDVKPTIKNNTTYLPLRFVTEQLGAQLQYDEKSKTVTVLLQGRMMQMKLNDQTYNLNGKLEKSEVAPFVSNNRTLIPVRLFSEKLGFTVNYDKESKSVLIY